MYNTVYRNIMKPVGISTLVPIFQTLSVLVSGVHCVQLGLGLYMGPSPPLVLNTKGSSSQGYPSPTLYATHPHVPALYSHVTPCLSPHFQLLSNFYGDYFKRGVLCASGNVGGGYPGIVRGGVAAGDGGSVDGGLFTGGVILKSFASEGGIEQFGEGEDLCSKVPRVCQLLNKNDQRDSRSLPSMGQSLLNSVRHNFNNLYSFVTRRSSSSSPPGGFPLFSLLSSPSFSQELREPVPTVLERPLAAGLLSAAANGSQGDEPCSGGGCHQHHTSALHSTRFAGESSGYHNFPGPLNGLSVCEESEGVAYPLVGVSAISGYPVRILQRHPDLTQPVFFRRCVSPRAHLLSGRCKQQFTPVSFLIDDDGSYSHFPYRKRLDENAKDEKGAATTTKFHPTTTAHSKHKQYPDDVGGRDGSSNNLPALDSGSDQHVERLFLPSLFSKNPLHWLGGGHKRYAQDYVMVETGCRVVVNLPFVRRDDSVKKEPKVVTNRKLDS